MTQKNRVLHVRVVGFSAPEKQMLNSIFLLSVAPARQIGYKLWNAESGIVPDMYLLDGDSDAAVASWQAAFSNTAERTLVVGSKNTDLGVTSAARPLGLKVVGAMDRLAIALNNKLTKEAAGLDVSAPASGGGTLPTTTQPTMSPFASTSASNKPMSTSMNAPVPAAPATPAAPAAVTATAAPAPVAAAPAPVVATPAPVVAAPVAVAPVRATPPVPAPAPAPVMTAAAPATTVLPSVTLQPNVTPSFEKTLEKSINERTVTDKAVDKILSEKPAVVEKPVEKPVEAPLVIEKTMVLEKPSLAAAALMSSGVTPLSPAALSAAVASSSTTRTNLRVISNPSPLAAELAAAAQPQARHVEAPTPPAPVVVPMPVAPAAPAASSPAPAPAAPTVTPVMQNSAPTPRHEEQVFRVLAVDDSPLMRTFLQNKLAPYGISPEFAASGEEALYKISKNHFDMIFLDVMLPGMDGYDVCKMIKKNKDNNLMKVVMLTSKDKTFDKIRGTMAGCDGYLTKPVDETKLRAIIERHTVTRK